MTSHTLHKVKYLHILWHPDYRKFNDKFVKMINLETEYFNPTEHLFITPHKQVYDTLSEYSNVVLAGNTNENLINKFGKYGDWIFVHALNCNKLKLLATKRKYAKKVIWRVWGHDINAADLSGNIIMNMGKKIIYKLFIRKVRQFYSLAGAKVVDPIAVKKIFGNVRFFPIAYRYGKSQQHILEPIYNEMLEEKKVDNNDELRVLVGHSGSPTDNHIEMLKILSKFKDEKIRICLILSYAGTPEYTDKVKDYAKSIFKDKAEIITDYMTYQSFVKYLSTIDIALFPQTHSAGLDNFSLLCFLNKVIMCRKVNPITDNMISDGCTVHTIEQLNEMSFQDLCALEPDPKEKELYGSTTTNQEICALFKEEVLDKLPIIN